MPNSVPPPAPGESSDVSWALESARTHWDRGNTQEALRWLSRAAQAAEQAGDNERAVTLANTATELRDKLGKAKSIPPTSGPVAVAADKPRTRPPPPPSARKGSTTPPTPSTPPPAAAPASARPSAPSVRTAQPVESNGSSRRSPEEPRSDTMPSPSSETGIAASHSSQARQATSTALRVSVKSSVRDPNLLLVRVLPAGKPAPPGTHEAFLQPARHEIDLTKLEH